MYIFKEREAIIQYLKPLSQDQSIGFVPTMGALHQGHATLINASLKDNDITICSVFVNPTQFNNVSDFKKYPQVLTDDILLLENLATDILFAPNAHEMYPNGQDNMRHYELGDLEFILEGEFRPGHFQGVSYIVDEFIQILKPTNIYMGEKDYQQIAVIKKVLELTRSNTKLVPCPTKRAESGLAMSSRNMRLSDQGTRKAAALQQALQHIKSGQKTKTFAQLLEEANIILLSNDFELEHIILCNADNLEILEDFDSNVPMRLVAAAYMEGVRLIDNIGV